MKNPTPADYYRTRLNNPLTQFLTTVPRGKELEELIDAALPPLPNDEVREFSVKERLRLNATVADFHVALGRDILLNETIVDLLEASLSARHPTPRLLAERDQIARDFVDAVIRRKIPLREAIGCALIGMSGVGKTRALNRILELIQQVVELAVAANPLLLPKMITWLRVECPANRKISALVEDIFTAIETAIGEPLGKVRQGNISIQLQNLAKVCLDYNVGLIVIDEVQHILRKNQAPDLELLNFLVELSNRVNLPLLLVGTPQAQYVVGGALRQARRMIGPVWENLPRDGRSWKKFSDRLLGYQFTKLVAAPEELEPTLYDLSQGLPAIAVALLQLAQRSALLLEIEEKKSTMVTAGMIQAAYTRHMGVVAPMLEALKRGDESVLALYQDLKIDPKAMKDLLLNQAAEAGKRSFLKLLKVSLAEERKAEKVIKQRTAVLARELTKNTGLTAMDKALFKDKPGPGSLAN
jgi:hypothetical protein